MSHDRTIPGRVHCAAFNGHRPCMTLVAVAQLIDPAMLVEIEAEAVIVAD